MSNNGSVTATVLPSETTVLTVPFRRASDGVISHVRHFGFGSSWPARLSNTFIMFLFLMPQGFQNNASNDAPSHVRSASVPTPQAGRMTDEDLAIWLQDQYSMGNSTPRVMPSR